MYADMKSCISLNGRTSGYFRFEKSVRQTEKLSVLSFAIYQNDIENYLINKGCDGININISYENIAVLLKVLTILYA